ncbi:AMP-binding protein [Maribacter polysaccharolyticus]|uniref:AMP-binding protein n=1 Tax=Maribacter polysaccharolyticus TaxID=3020831 RepID=UPI00237FA85B|nr:AMP-binding protein [Maribacter polysaccharolyticus]MDE3743387.1 AMP-binding protein [Maribacter polysaccharolyticus]
MYKEIHYKFKWNGVSITYDDLGEISYSLIKEGEPYQKAMGEFLLDWIDDKDYIPVKTSGSTGAPKVILLKKEHMVNSAKITGDYFDIWPGQNALLCLPGDYIAGKMMFIRSMVLGLDLDWVPPSSTPLKDLGRSYHFCAMVPMQLENSLDKINQIKTLIVGGAPVSADLKAKIQDKTTAIYETYGMTETITHVAVKKINNGAKDCFETLPNIKIEKDERNCLIINAPTLNNERIVTNDIVELVSDKGFKWLGRFDNVINSGGIKLIPEQIEKKLHSILENRLFVTGVPDTLLGQKLILLVEGKQDGTNLPEKIKSLKTLEKHEVPKEVLFVEKFVETVNGKVSRQKTLEKAGI